MSNRNSSPVQSVSDWLAVATDGLCAQAKRKIAAEIESHFTDAVERHCEHGQPESEAISIALAELGDPADSGHKFRQIYLTAREFEVVGSALRGVCHPRWIYLRMLPSVVCISIGIAAMVFGGYAGLAAGAVGIAFGIGCGILPLLVQSRMKREKFSPTTVRLILLSQFQTAILPIGLPLGLGLLLLPAILTECLGLRLFSKLHNMKYRWWETSENGRFARPGYRIR